MIPTAATNPDSAVFAPFQLTRSSPGLDTLRGSVSAPSFSRNRGGASRRVVQLVLTTTTPWSASPSSTRRQVASTPKTGANDKQPSIRTTLQYDLREQSLLATGLCTVDYCVKAQPAELSLIDECDLAQLALPRIINLNFPPCRPRSTSNSTSPCPHLSLPSSSSRISTLTSPSSGQTPTCRASHVYPSTWTRSSPTLFSPRMAPTSCRTKSMIASPWSRSSV